MVKFPHLLFSHLLFPHLLLEVKQSDMKAIMYMSYMMKSENHWAGGIETEQSVLKNS